MDGSQTKGTAAMAENESPGEGARPEAEGNEAATTTGGVTATATDPEAVEKVLRSERAKAREAEKRAKAAEARAQELEDKDKSAQEKAERRASEAEKAAATATSRLLRLEVAAEKGLEPKLAARLTGETKEELEADADDLLELLKGESSNSSSGWDGGARPPSGSPVEQGMNERIRAAARRR